MEALDFFGNTNDSSSITRVSDPFKKKCIQSLHIHCYPGNDNSFLRKRPVSATIDFENGNTQGTQRFKGDDIMSVLKEMYRFCEKLY